MSHGPIKWLDPEDYQSGYLDSKAFNAYCLAIRKIVEESDVAMSVGDIHRALGDTAKPSWTADALESILAIEPVGVLPTRYKPRNRVVAVHRTSDDWARTFIPAR